MSECSKSLFKVIYPSQLATSVTHSPFAIDTWGYTDIVVMTDEDGVEEGLRPTMVNLVRPFSRSYQNPRSLTMTSCRSTKSKLCVAGWNQGIVSCSIVCLPIPAPTTIGTDTAPRLVTGHSSQLPCRSGTEEDGMDESEYLRPSHISISIEPSAMPALVPLDGCEIKDNVRA